MDNEQIEELSRASSDDEIVLSLPVPDRIFGFHAQQAIEKQLKMLILGNRKRHEFTHNIAALRAAAGNLGEILPDLPFPIADLTDFSAQFRYTSPRDLSPTERDQIRQTVRILREHVQARLAVLNS
jgi:HEPN domain-containing protein